METRCVICKGRGLCGRPFCPILAKLGAMKSISIGDSIFGASPPSVFVGRVGYPDVRVGPLVPPEVAASDARIYDDPAQWLGRGIEDVIGLRSNLVRSNTRLNVRSPRALSDRLLVKTQTLAMASAPVDTEVRFLKPPKMEVHFDGILSPMGPSGALKEMSIAENPSVPRKVDHLVSDTDALAANAATELYESDISVYHINRLLSVGLLGRKKDRKLVPTRWAITATDDIVGKELIARIKDHSILDDIRLFSTQKFGNHFEILLLPHPFSFELIEIWMPRSVWTDKGTWIGADREGYDGKKSYSFLAGGYYAARLGVVEYLEKIKRQASIFIVREIRPDYWAPLGVWVIREAVRDAMTQKPKRFETADAALNDIAARIRTPPRRWKKETKLIQDFKFQKTLANF